MAFVIWITGLPGRSAVASALKEEIPDSVILNMDEFRKIVGMIDSFLKLKVKNQEVS